MQESFRTREDTLQNAVRTRGAVSCSANRVGCVSDESGVSGRSATGGTSGSVSAVNREEKGVLPATSATRTGTWEGSGKPEFEDFEDFEDSGLAASEALGSGTSSCDREDREAKSWYRNSSGRGGMTCDDGRSRSGGRAEELVPASRSGTCKAATGSGSWDSRVSGPNTSESLRSGTCSGDREREEARSGCGSSRSGSTTSDCEGSGTRIGASLGSGELIATCPDLSINVSTSFTGLKEVLPSTSGSMERDWVSCSVFHGLINSNTVGRMLRVVEIVSEEGARYKGTMG